MARGVLPAWRKLSEQRNYLLCIVNGLFARLGMNVTHPSLVLSVFVRALGGSNTLIGLLPAIRFSGWFLPQFLVAGWLQPQPRKVPAATVLEGGRMIIYAALTVLTCTLALSRPSLLLVLFLVLFSLSRLFAGASALARFDVIGNVIPPGRRATFFATRNLWGGLLVFGAGLLVRTTLDPDRGLSFPLNFTLLFGLSCACFFVALVSFYPVSERLQPISGGRHSVLEQLARAPSLLRQDAAFRRYLIVRVLLTMTRLADPFYPIFALDILGAPVYMVGFYLSAMTLAEIASNLVWQRVGRVRGTLTMLKASSLLTALTPLLAVALPRLMQRFGFTVETHGLLPAYLFTGVFLIAGSSQSGRAIGLMSLLLNVAPDEERASYVGLANTLLGFVSLLPIVSGAVIDLVGFAPVFYAAAFLLVCGYLATWGWRLGGVAGAEVSVRPGSMRHHP